MATILPPPSKRQRLEASERSREQTDLDSSIPPDAGSLRIQFFDETTGLPIGHGPVLVPVVDANPKNLELLLNTLQGHVSLRELKVPEQNVNLFRMLPNIFPIDSLSQYPRGRIPLLLSPLRFRRILTFL